MTDVNQKNKLDELSDNVISVPKKRWKILSDVGIKNNMMHSMGRSNQILLFKVSVSNEKR